MPKASDLFKNILYSSDRGEKYGYVCSQSTYPVLVEDANATGLLVRGRLAGLGAVKIYAEGDRV